MEEKRALITGITGQDGSYLAELLLSKGYRVYGIIRRSSHFNTGRIDHLFQDVHLEDRKKLELVYGDLTDGSSVSKIIRSVQPHEVYNLGAQSHVRVSFDNPEYTADATAMGTLRMLQAIKEFCPTAKFYQASSSEMFGRAGEFGFVPQNEKTPFFPASPYGVAKLFGHNITVNYRDSYKLFACSGILFNHESPRRGMTFVTRKVTRGVAMIVNGLQDKIFLGNLEAKRDWGFAPDYVRAMWMMLQQEEPDDYVIATGETHTIKELVIEAFKQAGIKDWENYIGVDPRYYRPTEVTVLLGDSTKAREKLGWKPEVNFKELVQIMVDHDLEDVTKTIEGRTDKLSDHKWSDAI